MPPMAAPESWRSAKPEARVLPLERHQARGAVRGRNAEHHEHGRDHAQEPGFPPQLAGMAYRPGAHSASHRGAEAISPLLVVPEHVVAGAGGRQQHGIARPGQLPRRGQHVGERCLPAPRSDWSSDPSRSADPPRHRPRRHGSGPRSRLRQPGVGLSLVPCRRGAARSCRSSAATATSVEVMLVDLESLIHSTPFTSRTGSTRCGMARNDRNPSAMRSSGAPRPRAPPGPPPAHWPRCDRPAAEARRAAAPPRRPASAVGPARSYQASAPAVRSRSEPWCRGPTASSPRPPGHRRWSPRTTTASALRKSSALSP